MKLPGIQYGGVQSLGRFDSSGPMRAANAAAAAARRDAQAAGATAHALRATGNVAMRYYEANAAAEYDRALAEAQKHDKMLREMLTSGPALAVDQVPDWVTIPGGRTETVISGGKEKTVPRRFVATYEVATQIYNGSMQRVRDAVTGEVRNPLARAQLNRALPKVFASGEAVVAGKQHEYYVDHQKGHVSAAVEDFIQAGDERSARMAVERAYHTGLLDPADYEKAMNTIGSRVDSMAYVSMLSAARSPEEVEQVEMAIRRGVVQQVDPATGQVVWGRSRLDPDKQWQMRGRAQTLLDEADTKRTRQHKDNMQGLLSRVLTNDLSASQVPALLGGDQLNHAQAITLLAVMKRQAEGANKTDAGAVDAFRRQISNARHLDNGERASKKFSQIELDLYAALNGAYPNGREYNGPSLSGDDHKKLLAESRREGGAASKSPEYRQAIGKIKAVTKYSPLAVALGGSAVTTRAYSDFRGALDDYIDRVGANADPLRFVIENADQFSEESYAGTGLQSFVRQNPDLGFTEAEVEEDSDMAKTRVYGEIMRRMRRGEIDEEVARIMIQQAGGEELLEGLDDSLELEQELDRHGDAVNAGEDVSWE